jgi:nucleoside phosphorylase
MRQCTSEGTARVLDELRALALPVEKFAVFGSGPMGVRGLRDMHDVDVIVAPELFAELASRHLVEDHDHGLHRIQIGRVEILDGWYPDVGPIEALIADAEIMDGLPFVKLDKVIEWKSMYGRLKDGADIEAIQHYLDAEAERAVRAAQEARATRGARATQPPVIQALTMEEFLPILTDAVIRGQPTTLYVSAGECDVTALWLRRRYDAQPPPRIERVVVLRMRDKTIADLERRQHLAKGFGNRLRENLAALQDLLTRRGVAFGVRGVDRIPEFHGYLYGEHLFRGSWTIDDRGYLHHRGEVLYFRHHSSPERFREAMAVFNAAPEVSTAPQPRRGLPKRQVTIGVLTPLKEEWEELIRVFPVVATQPANGGFYYVLDAGIDRVRLVGTYVGEMGPLPASHRAGRLIDHFKPDLVALAGIAGALDRDIQLGDVVAATEVNHFAATSKTVGGGKHYKFEYSGKHFSPEFVLAECHRHFSQAGSAHAQWQHDARRARIALGMIDDPKLRSVLPRDHAGHVASGDTVGAAKAYAIELLGIDRKFLALEMEAAGVAAAAKERPNPVWWIAVRGISDFSDARKRQLDRTGKRAWRRYAMHNAASYLRALFAWNDFMAHLEMRPRRDSRHGQPRVRRASPSGQLVIGRRSPRTRK